MISTPRVGQRVRLSYNPTFRPFAPYHGRIGVVVAVPAKRERTPFPVIWWGRRPAAPANCLVELEGDGVRVCVPRENLVDPEPRKRPKRGRPRAWGPLTADEQAEEAAALAKAQAPRRPRGRPPKRCNS